MAQEKSNGLGKDGNATVQNTRLLMLLASKWKREEELSKRLLDLAVWGLLSQPRG
jgi:hypothetical protein